MEFDVIFESATIHDGSGKPPYQADVGIKDEKIAALGKLNDGQTRQRINAMGKVLCPGFIDVHSHADLVIHKDNHAKLLEPLLRQGITTFVGGNCGMGIAPLSASKYDEMMNYVDVMMGEDPRPYVDWQSYGEFVERLEAKGLVMNCGLLAPHGLIRIAAKGLQNSKATREQIEQMKGLVEECLESGALGMSTGLMYFPGLAADEKELLELTELLVRNDAVFTCHLRSYSNTLPLAIEEVLALSRKTGVKSQISHFFWLPHVNEVVDSLTNTTLRIAAEIYKHVKFKAPLQWSVQPHLNQVARAVKQGVEVSIDVMPTGAGFTHALAFFPPWVLNGEHQDIIYRLSDKSIRQMIYKAIQQGKSEWPHREDHTWAMNFFKIIGFRGIYLMSVVSEKNKQYEGKNFIQIGKERGQHPFDSICDLLIEEEGRVLVFESPTHPGDEFVERSLFGAMKDPNVSIVTDTILLGFGKPSHLFYDCYPKVLSKYVREEKIISLAEAIRKSTSLPAQQLGIKKRGLVRKGYYADLVLFDAETICSNSTPFKPDAYPEGIDYVLVNGYPVVTPQGYFPEKRTGKVCKRSD
ncbi:amidohydrolase family protein [Deltaproteobacteria bacterium TL4]